MRTTLAVFFSVTILLNSAVAMAGPTPAQKCEAAKNGTAGKYAACLHKVQQKYVAGGSVDTTGRDLAIADCGTKYSTKWQSLQAKAGPGICSYDNDEVPIQDFLDACIFAAQEALGAGGTLPSDVVTCNSDLDLCAADLATCDDDLTTCGSDLSACNADLAVAEACGNGITEGAEACDQADLNAATCVTQGFATGTLRCTSGCIFDTSSCFATRYTDNLDGTVTDNLTRLQWEQKTTAMEAE